MIMREREQCGKKLPQLYRTLNKERRGGGVGVIGGGWWVVVGG